jgi:signal transduction histidine kinase
MLWGTAQRLRKAAALWRTELIIFVLAAACAAAGAFAGLQNKLNDLSFSLLKRAASDEIVVVQIDARSLNEIATWPWPRGKHAEVIDRLIASGAQLVAVDIDFSSASTPAEDARLAKSVTAATGRVVLPSFMQHAQPGVTSELVETNPLPSVRDGALIGNANVFAPDGEARRASLGLYLPDGRYRPTFAGLVGQRGSALIREFDIDFAIDPATFRKISYVDVLNGKFDAGVVAGKRVLIGATAVELGDRVPVPVYSVIAGVELQALIAENILSGRMLWSPGLAGGLLLVALVLAFMRPGRASWSFKDCGRPFATCAAALLAAPTALMAAAPIVIETAPAIVALGSCFVFIGAREFAGRARTVLRERSSSNLRRAMIHLIVEESSDGVVVANANGRIELCNERAARLLNATRSVLLLRDVSDYLPRFESMAQPLNNDASQRHTDMSVECDGQALLLEVSARRIALQPPREEHAQATQIDVYTLRDVTATRRAQDAERRALDERLTIERAKSNFIANMSHELRTPLNAIIGFSEMIAKEALGPVGVQKYAEFSDLVAKSGHHLLSLINNVIEVSRLDDNAGEIQTAEIDFNDSVQSCIAMTRNLRDYKHQTIIAHVGGAPLLNADARLIKHVLANLLSNAVKFSGEAGNISITAWGEGDAFVFEVTDDGVGIDPALMPHLTELFYQTDRSFTRKHDGLGMGLYLVKRYLDRMNGSLTFESEPGKGTTVRVSLPGAAGRTRAASEAA